MKRIEVEQHMSEKNYNLKNIRVLGDDVVSISLVGFLLTNVMIQPSETLPHDSIVV
jgi:hypothetical protein